MARFCPLFSGSGGNSYYIGSSEKGILIDAGRSAKQLEIMLQKCQIDISAIKAIFITHEHSDHIKGLRVFASRYGFPVYASSGTLEALNDMGCLNDSKFKSFRIDSKGMDCAGLSVKPFKTSHDSAESMGYRVKTSDGRKVTICTDVGYLSDEVHNNLCGSDMAVLESNHDVGMLENGPYPYTLKRRILSETGHLSNADCAAELCELTKSGTTRFVLVHLSEHNNTPELAFQTSLCSLSLLGLKKGTDFELYVAPKENSFGKSIYF